MGLTWLFDSFDVCFQGAAAEGVWSRDLTSIYINPTQNNTYVYYPNRSKNKQVDCVIKKKKNPKIFLAVPEKY